MSPKKRKDVVGSTDWDWSLKGGTTFYLVVQGQDRVFMPAYIEEVDIWSGVTDPSQTHSETTKYRTTQLV